MVTKIVDLSPTGVLKRFGKRVAWSALAVGAVGGSGLMFAKPWLFEVTGWLVEHWIDVSDLAYLLVGAPVAVGVLGLLGRRASLGARDWADKFVINLFDSSAFALGAVLALGALLGVEMGPTKLYVAQLSALGEAAAYLAATALFAGGLAYERSLPPPSSAGKWERHARAICLWLLILVMPAVAVMRHAPSWWLRNAPLVVSSEPVPVITTPAEAAASSGESHGRSPLELASHSRVLLFKP